ncbi:MAG: LPS export ABC transporter protein LptC [Vicingaceae bacterium]
MKQKTNLKRKSTFLKYCLPVLFGVLFSCSNDIDEVKKYDNTEILPDQVVKEVEVMYSTSGNVVFQLNAPLLNQYGGNKNYNEMPEGVEVKIFDDEMNVTTKLTSNYAIDSTYANKMQARENVIVVNEKGEQLNTEELLWNKETEQITSDVFVKITTTDQIIMGTGLISNQNFTEYRILQPSGIINIEND